MFQILEFYFKMQTYKKDPFQFDYFLDWSCLFAMKYSFQLKKNNLPLRKTIPSFFIAIFFPVVFISHDLRPLCTSLERGVFGGGGVASNFSYESLQKRQSLLLLWADIFFFVRGLVQGKNKKCGLWSSGSKNPMKTLCNNASTTMCGEFLGTIHGSICTMRKYWFARDWSMKCKNPHTL